MVVRQVADGVPAYEVKDEVGNVKTVHRNWLFLVATPKEAITPLGAGASISEENVWSTHVEHTSLEVESNLPERFVDGDDTLSPSSRVPLRWIGGVLWLLPSVAQRPTNGEGEELEMEWGARAMRKSTRPADGTSEPCSHIPDTRCYKRGGGTTAVMGTFVPGSYLWGRRPQ